MYTEMNLRAAITELLLSSVIVDDFLCDAILCCRGGFEKCAQLIVKFIFENFPYRHHKQ